MNFQYFFVFVLKEETRIQTFLKCLHCFSRNNLSENEVSQKKYFNILDSCEKN